MDCGNFFGKAFLLDGVLCEVVEVFLLNDERALKPAKYARAMLDRDVEMSDAGSEAANMQEEDEELEETTAAEAAVLLAMETTEVPVEEMHALLGLTDQCNDKSGSGCAVHSNYVGSEGGTVERMCGVKFMWGLFTCTELSTASINVLECWALPRAPLLY